jgi:hypothetical protein
MQIRERSCRRRTAACIHAQICTCGSPPRIRVRRLHLHRSRGGGSQMQGGASEFHGDMLMMYTIMFT